MTDEPVPDAEDEDRTAVAALRLSNRRVLAFGQGAFFQRPRYPNKRIRQMLERYLHITPSLLKLDRS